MRAQTAEGALSRLRFVYHRGVQRLRLLVTLMLVSTAVRASAQATPEADAPEPAPFAPLPDEARSTRTREPILLVGEGLEALGEPSAIRKRLGELFARPVVGLADPEASSPLATLYLAVDARFVVLRLRMDEHADLWRRLPRTELGVDPVSALGNAVLDMLWSDKLAQSAGSEMVDPFCPPGLICMDAEQPTRRRYRRRLPVEPTVLDPWDGSYQRFGTGDDLSRERRYHTRGDPWADEQPGSHVAQPASSSPVTLAPAPPLAGWAVGLSAGGGVHAEGGFVRYEVDLLRRFRSLDVGLAFVGGRGQPDAAASARRAVVALIHGRLVMDGLELDLGGSFGTFMAKARGEGAEVRPYLRVVSVFALPITSALHFTIQSEVGTTFSEVGESGAFEYALSLGFRQRL